MLARLRESSNCYNRSLAAISLNQDGLFSKLESFAAKHSVRYLSRSFAFPVWATVKGPLPRGTISKHG